MKTTCKRTVGDQHSHGIDTASRHPDRGGKVHQRHSYYSSNVKI